MYSSEENSMILIQGFFFQKKEELDLSFASGEAEAVVRTVMERSMFSGVIGPTESGSDVLVGRATDYYGESSLRNVLIKGDTFSFVKRYDRRSDRINYRLKKITGNIWQGSYWGKATGSGIARCILTIVPEGFLHPVKLPG